jgi:hypothetical protein
MPGKAELVAVLARSAQVVEVELRLLAHWRPDCEPGRQAQIDATARYIGVGLSCARRRTAYAVNEANALPDVAHPPSSQHLSAVAATVNSIAGRLQWPGPDLTDEWFDNALRLAQANSDQAADNSEAIYADCVHGGDDDPPANLAAVTPANLLAVLPADPDDGRNPQKK